MVSPNRIKNFVALLVLLAIQTQRLSAQDKGMTSQDRLLELRGKKTEALDEEYGDATDFSNQGGDEDFSLGDYDGETEYTEYTERNNDQSAEYNMFGDVDEPSLEPKTKDAVSSPPSKPLNLGTPSLQVAPQQSSQDIYQSEVSEPAMEVSKPASSGEAVSNHSQPETEAVDQKIEVGGIRVLRQNESSQGVDFQPVASSDLSTPLPIPNMNSEFIPNSFAGAPPSGSIRGMAQGEAPNKYTVEQGDTLFDICDQLLDEPSYWPKLWAVNPFIKNPHFIYPGMVLQFYPGDEATPPYLQVVSEEDVVPIENGGLDQMQLVREQVVIPSEAYSANAPIEIVSPAEVTIPDNFSDLFDGDTRRNLLPARVIVRVPAFVFAEEREVLGEVIGGIDGENTIIESQKMAIEHDAALVAGKTYSILRPSGSVENPETGSEIGYRYEFVGNVKVSSVASSELAVGESVEPRLMVLPGDIVTTYISTIRTIPSISSVGPIQSVQSNVIGFDYHKQSYGGEGQFVLLDRTTGSLSAGSYVAIYAKSRPDFESYDNADVSAVVAVARIVDITDVAAVGFIVKSIREVRVGDRLAVNRAR